MAEPKFVAKHGQVNYTDIRYAPKVHVVVTHSNKILCVRRSTDMRLYPGQWDWVSGFLDDDQSIEDKASQQLGEELGMAPEYIVNVKRGQIIIEEAPEYQKTWFIVPVLAEISTDKFTLDWEASSGQWFSLDELKTLDMVPGSLPLAAQFFPELL
ncbi:MAG TPA: NUDIX domain-containing protein [Candidatus Saccharimonadales bacterium]|nr:NUDIX domain-containing protein [Candidatus Saccharimonadales bacterium]